jgi:predicted membrane channel-forming protein YqfA (hemolysin III family)
MKILGSILLTLISGYAIQKLTYEKTLIFQDRWGNIIRHTIGVFSALPFILLFYKLLKGLDGIGRVGLSYLVGFSMFGAGVVAANMTDHPDLLNGRKEDIK